MRDKKIDVRVSDEEKKQINDKAKSCGLSNSEFLRRLAFDKKITSKLTPEEIDNYKTLRIFYSNFSSIANMFKKSDPQLNQEVRKVAKLVQSHLMKMQ